MSSDLVVVTGGAGFIGSNIVAMLAEDGANVVVSDHFARDDCWRYLAPYAIHDIVYPSQLAEWLKAHEQQVRAIVHMGAISSTTETDAAKIVTNNIRFSLDLWEFAAQTDKTFIYASSAATYGDGSAGFIDDDSPAALAHLEPLNLYGWSKHVVDRRIAQDVTQGRPTPSIWAGLKFFNVYGPNEAHKGGMRSVVHQIYPLAARGDTVRLFKSDHPDYVDGGQLRDFIYVKDCCEIVQNILRARRMGGIFNAGTGAARTYHDLARAVFGAIGREPLIEYVDMPEKLRGKYQYFTEASISKLQRAGIAPAFRSLEDGVADYVQGHLLQEFRHSRPPANTNVEHTVVLEGSSTMRVGSVRSG